MKSKMRAWEKKAYKRALRVISQPDNERKLHDMQQLEPWFRKKSALFSKISSGLCCIFLFKYM